MKKFYNVFKTLTCLSLCLIILTSTTGICTTSKRPIKNSDEIILDRADDPICSLTK